MHVGYRQSLEKIAGKTNEDIKDTGWVALPSIENGTVVSIKYRSLQRKAFSRQPGMKTTLFNLDSVDPLEPIILVEGEIDALSLEQIGYRAVSLPSASFTLTPEMRDALEQADSIILAGDNDGKVGVDAMERLKRDFGDKALLVKWTEGKDANECALKLGAGFKDYFEGLVSAAKSQPFPGVYSLAETMMSGDQTPLIDHPDRLRFPWKNVDEMAISLPGAVVFSTSTNTGMGKTVWWMNVSLHGARKYNEIVLNYQAEINESEFSNMAAAHLVMRDRNNLTRDDYKKASILLKDVRYYIGSDPTLSTSAQVLDLIEAAVKRLGITTVVLDHIHYICGSESDPIQAQDRAMKRIKDMARIYSLKFIVLGQPRKADQKTRGKEMHITDSKGAGSISDNANTVYFLHREVVKNIDPGNPPMDEYEPETTVRLKKGRSKGRGSTYAKLFYSGATATFLEIDANHEEGLFS